MTVTVTVTADMAISLDGYIGKPQRRPRQPRWRRRRAALRVDPQPGELAGAPGHDRRGGEPRLRADARMVRRHRSRGHGADDVRHRRGVLGRRPTLPDPGLRAHPQPPADPGQGRRHHLHLRHRRHPQRPRPGEGRHAATGTSTSRAAQARCSSTSGKGSSTSCNCTWCPPSSARACGSSRGWAAGGETSSRSGWSTRLSPPT